MVLWWIGLLIALWFLTTSAYSFYSEKSCLSSLPIGSPIKWEDGTPDSYSVNRYGTQKVETLEEQKVSCFDRDKYNFVLSLCGIPFFVLCYILSGSLIKPPKVTN